MKGDTEALCAGKREERDGARWARGTLYWEQGNEGLYSIDFWPVSTKAISYGSGGMVL